MKSEWRKGGAKLVDGGWIGAASALSFLPLPDADRGRQEPRVVPDIGLERVADTRHGVQPRAFDDVVQIVAHALLGPEPVDKGKHQRLPRVPVGSLSVTRKPLEGHYRALHRRNQLRVGCRHCRHQLWVGCRSLSFAPVGHDVQGDVPHDNALPTGAPTGALAPAATDSHRKIIKKL